MEKVQAFHELFSMQQASHIRMIQGIMPFKKNWEPVSLSGLLAAFGANAPIPARKPCFGILICFNNSQFIEKTTGACRIPAIPIPVPSPACQNVLIYFLFSMTHSNSNPSSLPKRILSQFATYRSAISRVAFLTTFLVISFLASLPEVSRAASDMPGQAGVDQGVGHTRCGVELE